MFVPRPAYYPAHHTASTSHTLYSLASACLTFTVRPSSQLPVPVPVPVPNSTVRSTYAGTVAVASHCVNNVHGYYKLRQIVARKLPQFSVCEITLGPMS